MLETHPRYDVRAPRARRELPETRFFGNYRIVRKIAEGGFGEVYEAMALSGRHVAIKLPLINDERATDDFLRELDIVRDLDHPHVVPILDAEWINGLPTIAYPLGEGSVAERIDEGGLWPSEAQAFSEQLLDGLTHVHERGYLHCDLKPGNLIVFPGELLGITDFGLARDLLEEGAYTTSGTPEYMAPEHNDGYVSTRSDVYEAAVVIVEMLMGRLPDEGLLDRSLQEQLPDSPSVEALSLVLQRALAPHPEDRFQDAGEFAREFRGALRCGRLH